MKKKSKSADTLKKHPTPWKVVFSGEEIKLPSKASTFYEVATYNDCIVDANGFQVIGSSENMIGAEHLQFIVDCVNTLIKSKNLKYIMNGLQSSYLRDESND